MAQKLLMDGRVSWLKTYQERSRSRLAATRMWNMVAQGLGACSLVAPPQHGGEKTKQVEIQRIIQLRSQGVRVPEILAEGREALLLSDIGPSLSGQLKGAANDGQIDDLVHCAVGALVAAHGNNAYLGQAFARNITASEGRIGFIDFEEDPLQVMPLAHAQARDWLMFSAGVSRHYESRPDALAGMLRQAAPQLDDDVVSELRISAERLKFLHRCTRYMGKRARAIGVAVLSVRNGFAVLALGLMIDILTDGDSDVFNFLSDIL